MGIDWETILDEEDGAKLQDAYDAAIARSMGEDRCYSSYCDYDIFDFDDEDDCGCDDDEDVEPIDAEDIMICGGCGSNPEDDAGGDDDEGSIDWDDSPF